MQTLKFATAVYRTHMTDISIYLKNKKKDLSQ